MLGHEHPDAVETMNDLALAIHLQGRHAESEPLNREVLSLLRSHYGPLDLRVATAHQNLATDLEPLGRVAEAVDHYHQALAIRRRIIGEGDPTIGQILLLLAELYRYQEDYPRALSYARQAYEAIARTRGKNHPHLAYVLRETGRIYSQQRRFREAEPYLRSSLDLRLRVLDARHPDLAKSQVSLARCLIGLGRDSEAVPLLREAQVTFVQVYGADADISQVPGQLLAEIAARRAR
jgi:tetratricopeptide (TPR) repeat protein